MDSVDLIWAEVEIEECADTVSGYGGQISILDYENIYNGSYQRPFLKIQNVHWYRYPDFEDEELGKGRVLRNYGHKLHSQYQGEIIVKAERIISIQRLKHGPKDLDQEG